MDREWIDLLWHLLAYPVYQILGTIRHEACHAIVARSFGASIVEFKFLPHRREGKWNFGYVRWVGDLDRGQRNFVKKAPYLLGVVMIVCGVWLHTLYEFKEFHWFVFATVMLVVSPVVDLVYNLFKALVWKRGDLVDE